jgi:Ca2+-binding RTX toxin-like protein
LIHKEPVVSTRLPHRRSTSRHQQRRSFLNQTLERARHRKLHIESLEDRRVMAFNMTLAGTTATVTGDAAADTLIIDQAGGLLQHNRFTVGDAGFNSNLDWDNSVAGDQTLAAAVASTVNIATLGDGDDVLQLGTVAAPMTSLQALVSITAAGIGNDALIMENSAAAAMTINYTSTTVTGPGINISNLTAFENGETLNTGAAGSITNITSSANSLAVVGSASSTVNIGTGTTAGILGAISVSNPPSLTALVVNDSANAAGRNVTWAADTITGLTGSTITYVNVDISSVAITTGSGADTFTLSDSVSATTNTINSGAGSDIFNVTSSGLGGGSTNNYNGQGDNDTFNITGIPAAGVTVNVDGGAHTTGDMLNITAAVAANIAPGSVTATGSGSINHTNIESLNLLAITAANFVGTAAADVLTVDRASAGTNRATFTGSTPVIFPTSIPFTFDAQGGDDELSIVQNAAGLPLFGGTAAGGHTNAASGVALANINANFIGGAGTNDRLRYTFTSAQTAAYYSDVAATANSGVVTVGGINLSFEGLAPVIFAGAGGSLLVDASANAGLTTMTISDDLANTAGVGGNQVTGNNAFETAFFRGFGSVTVRSGDGIDTINLTSLDAVSTETVLNVDTDNIGNTDASADIINVASLPATVTANLLGGAGADTFNVGSDNTLIDVLGPINVSPAVDEAGAGDTLNVNASADVAAKTVLLTTNTIEGMTGFAGNPDINYGNGDQIETINITTTASTDAVNVQSTRTGSTYNLSTLAGADTIVVSSDAPAGLGNLNAIDGQVNIQTGTEIDTVRISDIGDAAGDTYTLNQAAGIGSLTFNDGAAGTDITWTGAQLENFILNTSNTGGDTLNVLATSATTLSAISSGGGNDTWTITGDALSATNVFNSDAGNDTLTLNIATHIGSTALFGVVAVTINGGDPAVSSENRDRLNINDNNAAFARDLNYDYQNAAGGLNIAAQSAGNGLFGGNGGGNLSLNTTGLETVVFNSGGTNDQVRVTGTSANDLLTVGLVSTTAATVFLGGTPYLEAPPSTVAGSLPGVAGGGNGPDLLINGMSTAAGLRLFGDGNGGVGDRAIVYASSENPLLSGGALNIFGLGAGVLIPGFGVGNAYDRISVNGALVPAPVGFTDVRVLNLANADVRIPVLVDTTSFVQATPPSPAQQAAVIVNAGDEAVAQGTGVSDDIYAFVSPSFNIQVNGNLPDLVLGPDGFPIGDQLNISGPGDTNIFSDKATPPNVTVTFSGNPGPFGITNSSIERLSLVASNGVVNLIGDNNDPTVDQNDNFVVVGRDIDGNSEGVNELTLEINGSAPILINNVFFLNTFGDDQNPPPGTPSVGNDIDTLEITPYADDTPRGWGIDVSFNEGNPTQADGNQQDLIILHTSLFGGQVSENIVIKPSGPDNGEIIVTNASFGTPIVDIDFINNTDIIILDDDGFLNDTDSLTLLGTNPDALQTSGNETFIVNSAASQLGGGDAGSLVTVRDTATTDILYRLRGFLNPIGAVFAPIASLTLQGLAGNDIFDVSGPDLTAAALFGDVQVNFLGGEGDDLLDIDLALNAKFSGTGLFYDGGTGADALTVTGGAALATPLTSTTYTPGAALGAGKLTYADGALANMVIDFVNLEPVIDLVVSPTLIVNANNASNAINYGPGSVAGRGLVSIDDHETIEFANKVTLVINALAGDDTINVSPALPTGLTGITINGGDPGAADELIVTGTTASEAFEYAPTGTTDSGSVLITGFAPVAFATVSAVTIDGRSTVADDTLTVRTEAGTDFITLTPGANFDSGTVDISSTAGTESTPRLTFLGIGQDATLTFQSSAVDNTRSDLLIYNGTDTSDEFDLLSNGLIGLNTQINVIAAGVIGVRLNGLNGDDVFTVAGNHPFTTGVLVDGGNPGIGSDSLSFIGGGAAITANLALNNIIETGFGPVTYVGVEDINITAAGAALTVNGTIADDRFDVQPTAAGTGSFQVFTTGSLVNTSPQFTYSGVNNAAFTINGGAGFDDVHILGNASADTVTATANTITRAGGTVTFGADLERVDIDTFDGNDNIDISTFASVPAIIRGGLGNDTIVGSTLNDLIYGGSGNDLLRGGGGSDTIYGEDGNDTFGIVQVGQDPGDDFFFGGDGSDLFIWNPTDGNDTFEGGAGESDRLQFEGNDNANSFILNQVGTRLEFRFGAVDLDLASTEEVDIVTRGGIDTVTINDLYATEVRHINVDSGAAGAVDTVTIQGREVTDNVNINNVGDVATVTGLRYDIRVLGTVLADNDVLIFNANDGNDTVTANDNLQALYAAANLQINGGAGDDFISGHGTLSGGAGNDTLSGGSASQVISGGDGNDLLLGGAGDDTLNGGAGEDTFVGGLGADTIDGGDGFDTVLIQGTSADDRIDVRQDPLNAAPPAATSFPLLYEVSNAALGFDGVIGGAGTETDTIVTVAASTTVENVTVQAGSGADIIRVGHDDSYVGRALFTMRITVDGGPGGTSDRLVFRDLGAGDTTIQRISEVAGSGSYTLGTNAPVVYSDVEFAAIDIINPVTGGTGSDGLGNGRLFVFKPDPFEQNPSRPNATHLGANATYNVDPLIDPASDALFGAGGDEDWYRVVAESTGTLDFTIYFRQQGPLANGRAGLPGDGNLQLEAYDAISGTPITGFGGNENAVTDVDERIRIPVVAGQSYYFRVFGAPSAVNVYGITTINTAAPVARDLELHDIVAGGEFNNPATRLTVGALVANGFTTPANPQLPVVNGFYDGKFVYFLAIPGNPSDLNGQRAQVVSYTNDGVNATFTFAPGSFTGPAAVGDVFLVESIDTGRSQFDNHTRDNTPTIFFRLDDAVLLNDLPGNPAGQTNAPPPDQVIPIIYQLNGALSPSAQPAGGFTPGFRVAIFDESDTHNPVFLGYATQVNATGLYTFTFVNALTTGSHFITAKVEMIDPADTTVAAGIVRATGFGAPSQSLEIVVDTTPPQVYFGLPTSTETGFGFTATDGLHPDSDTGIDGVPDSFEDNITANLTPRFYGTAEANSIIRLYVDNLNVVDYPGTVIGSLDAFDILIDQTVAVPEDGTNQLPGGWWEAESTVSFNDPQFFPIEDGLRTIFATAEDVAGNVGAVAIADIEELAIFVDTVGPQVTDVRFNSVDSTYNVFDHKYETVQGNSIATLGALAGGAGYVPGVYQNVPLSGGAGINAFAHITVGPGGAVTNVTLVNGGSGFAVGNVLTTSNANLGGAGAGFTVTVATVNAVTFNSGTLVPTPLVNSIIVKVQDLPARVANFVYQAIYTETNLVDPVTGAIINGGVDDLPLGLVNVVGDYSGNMPIRRITFTADQNPNTVALDPFTLPDIARGYITITFGSDPNGIPGDADDTIITLPDDRFTLTLSDEIRDPVGNRLDGESQAIEPHDQPDFPSGNGIPGGDFVSRFTVDTRPELGTWAAGSAWIDINGNQIFDPDNTDFTNRDIAFLLGYTSDELFAGNFAATGAAAADGFDKLAAYGRVNGQWRWQIDTDNDGVPNIEVVDPSAINGFPVAGNFGPNAGDEVGVFTGSTWYLDTDHDFQVNDPGGSRVVQWPVIGYGFTGDFDGDGNYDLGTWTDDTFQLSLSSLSGGLVDGTIDRTFHFGFSGARERPVAADMNMDGIDDIGLWTPDRATQTEGDAAEWYWLMSGVVANDTPGAPLGPIGPTIAGGLGAVPPNGRIVPDPITLGQNLVKFTPVPFGNDLYMQFGDEFSLPIVGNFDPPATLTSTMPMTNRNNHLDVNNDGKITAFDALSVINRLNSVGAGDAPSKGFLRAPFFDVNSDTKVTAFDALWVINYLNAHPPTASGSAGEDIGVSEGENSENDEALLAVLGEEENN